MGVFGGVRWSYHWANLGAFERTSALWCGLWVTRVGSLYVSVSGLYSDKTTDLSWYVGPKNHWWVDQEDPILVHEFTQFTVDRTSEIVSIPTGFSKYNAADAAGLPQYWFFECTTTATVTIDFAAVLTS